MALRRISRIKQSLLHLPRPFSSFSNHPPLSPPPSSDPDVRLPLPPPPSANHGKADSQEQEEFSRQINSDFELEVFGEVPPWKCDSKRFHSAYPTFEQMMFGRPRDDFGERKKDAEKKKSTKTARAGNGITSTAEPTQIRADATDVESDGESLDERELEKEVSVQQKGNGDDLQKLDQGDARFPPPPPPNHGEAASQKPAERLSPHISYEAIRESIMRYEKEGGHSAGHSAGFAMSSYLTDMFGKPPYKIKKDDEEKSTKTVSRVTSTAEPSQRAHVTDTESDGEFQDERELEKEGSVFGNDDDFQKPDQGGTAEQKDQEDEQVNQRSGSGGTKVKPKKSPNKPKKSPKEDAMDCSITRCMTLLRSLEGLTPAMKVRCYDVFKCAKNCEIFINAVAEEDGSALAWLQIQIGKG